MSDEQQAQMVPGPEPPKSRGEKVADRPHEWTVLSWFIGPTIAAVSIVFSVYMSNRAIRTSELAMKVAQRAYVVATNCRLSTRAIGSRRLVATYQCAIKNIGKTPGKLLMLDADFNAQEGGLVDITNRVPQTLSKQQNMFIAQDQTIEWKSEAVFELGEEAFKAAELYGVYVLSHITVEDAFSDKYDLKWTDYFDGHIDWSTQSEVPAAGSR